MGTENTVINFLENLGLTSEEATIYLTLLKKGDLTTLELSRATSIERTKIYRLLEKLKKEGIVEEVVDEKKKLAKAVGVHKLELLVKEQEAKSRLLREVLPDVKSLISGSRAASQPGTRVLFYRGREGIKQLVWNTLRAKKEIVGYTSFRKLSEYVGEDFMERWIGEFPKRNLFFRDIVSDFYLESEGGVEGCRVEPERFRSRYLSSKILTIDHQVDIYNNIVAYYNFYKGEVFGIEIYNEKIARMQKQLFEAMWKIAKPIKLNTIDDGKQKDSRKIS